MAYVNVADWKPEQVSEWLKGLDATILPYVHLFVGNNVNGRQLLDMQPDVLENLGVLKAGHQEIILEAIQLLRNFHYDLDRENLQLLALRLMCVARSLQNELQKYHENNVLVTTRIMADAAYVISAAKPLVCWLIRKPFSGQEAYIQKKKTLIELSLEIAMNAVRDRFAVKPVESIRNCCQLLAELANGIIQDVDDSLLLQPASLDLATLKKRPGDHLITVRNNTKDRLATSNQTASSGKDYAHAQNLPTCWQVYQHNMQMEIYYTSLGFYVMPSYQGIHQVGEIKCNSAAHQSGKVESGDEIVQINYQTVVGWQIKRLMALFEEGSTEVFLTMKKRPRHSKVCGQIYIKPYRLPCRKHMGYPSRWNELIPPSRPELLSIPPLLGAQLRMINARIALKCESVSSEQPPPSPTPSAISNSSSSGEEFMAEHTTSPTSVRLYLPKPRIPVQRRATISGSSPISKSAPISLEQFWHELKLEREWRSINVKNGDKSVSIISLERAPSKAHSSLNWSVRLCDSKDALNVEKSPHSKESEESRNDSNTSHCSIENSKDGIIPLKQRIECLNKAMETSQMHMKPKLPPKPLISRPEIPARIKSTLASVPINMRNTSISVQRERGKLDKSYSTPTYDYSIIDFIVDPPVKGDEAVDANKTKSEDNVIAKVDLKKDKPNLGEAEIYKKFPIRDENFANEYKGVSVTTEECEKLEEEVDGIEKPVVNNKILDTINSSLLQQDSEFDYVPDYKLTRKQHQVAKEDQEEELVYIPDFISQHEQTPKHEHESLEEQSKSPLASKQGEFQSIQLHKEPMLLAPATPHQEFQKQRQEMVQSPPEITTSPHKLTTESIKSELMTLPLTPLVIHTTIDVPATFPRNKMDHKKIMSPPEPPPRPSRTSFHAKISSSSRSLPTPKSSKAAAKSPKPLRKKNPLLIKRRNVGTKDLGVTDYEGWLFHRFRTVSRGSVQWIKGWFVIKGTIFYGFNAKESTKARLMISLPGFTVSPAEEVKSRHYAFKVYHTGTTFYFAAESSEDLNNWVAAFAKVTVAEEEQNIVVSETDGEDDGEGEVEVKKDKHESISLLGKKLTGLLSGHLSSSSHDSSKGDKKFNSLKKNTRKVGKEDGSLGENHAASLDRKYLKFLGSNKPGIVPVPTAQFRSYRRVPAADKNLPSVLSPEKTQLESNNHQMTMPVPNTSRPPDMADYRLTASVKNTAVAPRNQPEVLPQGYMTLEVFTQNRQEEGRRHRMQLASTLQVPQCHAPPPPAPTTPTTATHHNVAAVIGHEGASTSFQSTSSFSINAVSSTSKHQKNSSERKWTDFLLHNQKSSSDAHLDNQLKQLKKSNQYQPPPWEPQSQGPIEDNRLHPAFEMALDQGHNGPSGSNSGGNNSGKNKLKSDESSGSGGLRLKHIFGSKGDGHKNLISSPRLKRVFKRGNTKNDDNCVVEFPAQERCTPNAYVTPEDVAPSARYPPAPEYPELEYPPIFEPGTYSLSNVSTIIRARRMQESSANNSSELPTISSNENQPCQDVNPSQNKTDETDE